MTLHAVDALARFREHELLDGLAAGAAGEARGMIGLVAGHDSLLHDGQAADLARVVALGAYRMAIGKEQDVVAVCGDEAFALRAPEAIDVPKLSAMIVQSTSKHWCASYHSAAPNGKGWEGQTLTQSGSRQHLPNPRR